MDTSNEDIIYQLIAKYCVFTSGNNIQHLQMHKLNYSWTVLNLKNKIMNSFASVISTTTNSNK